MNDQNQQQINAESEEWVTIIDPQTGLPRRVRRGDFGLNEVRPGVGYSTPTQQNLNED